MTSLVVVILYDFQDRKFHPRYISHKDEVIEDVRQVETVLYSYKTKLAAALAKCRIKHSAPTIEYILPEVVRKQEQRASTLPFYAWINTAKTSLTEVLNTLKKEGFTKVDSPSDLDGYKYCMDNHCQDLLIFPSHLKEEMNNMEMFIDYKLLFQEKSHNLAVHSVKALLSMDDDIIVANPCPGFTLAHMSVLTNPSGSNIYVCGVKSESRKEELMELFTSLECKNIKMLKESFTDIDPSDPRLQKAKIILLLPQCSGSGVSDPVEFVLSEHGDTALLQDLSQGSVSADRLNGLAKQQLSEINHAMKFSKVLAVVYCTCSVYPEENEHVINQALQFQMEGVKEQPYRLSPPVIPLCSSVEIISASNKFYQMEPSDTCNGCFLAVLTRERDTSESVRNVLARAAAKGLLGGIEAPKTPKREKKKKSKTVPKTITPTSVAQAKITDFLNRENNISGSKTPTSNQDQNNSQKNLNNISVFQGKNQSKQVSSPTTSITVKHTHGLPPKGKVLEWQQNAARLKLEEKIVLKPVQIMLPPVMAPYYSTQPPVQIRGPIHYYHQRWHTGARSISPKSPTLSIVGKSKETPAFTILRHPKPWH
ncbi:putative methyltransferase NSUN7 isoform X2 [Mixophyes fleayi]